jgi:predicted peptidase
MMEGLLGPRGEWVNLFEERVWRADPGADLPYRLLSPEKLPAGRRFPLVLFLHGAGERGDNNRSQLRHGVRRFALPEARTEYPAFVLVPQCPAGESRNAGYWLGRHPKARGHGGAEGSGSLPSMLLDLVRATMEECPVDPRRIYITGISMGGFATWALMAMRPDLFAAAVPVCGGGDPGWAPRIKDIPVWAFHGSNDTVVPVDYTRRMIKSLRAAGGDPKYTEYAGVGHDSWTPAYREPDLLDWIFGKQKS